MNARARAPKKSLFFNATPESAALTWIQGRKTGANPGDEARQRRRRAAGPTYLAVHGSAKTAIAPLSPDVSDAGILQFIPYLENHFRSWRGGCVGVSE
jgi:hypothetical protein